MDESPVVWTVIDQREESREDVSGVYVSGVTVRFRTGSGAIGSVFCPDRDYTPARVQQLIGDRARAIEAVAHLTGSA